MKAVYVQKGESLDYLNESGKAIDAGEVVVFGSRIGIAGTFIPAGEVGTLHMKGVFKVPKKTGETIEAGADVHYTEDGFSAAVGVAVSDTEGSEVGTAKVGEATVGARAASGTSSAVGYAVKKAEDADSIVMINL